MRRWTTLDEWVNDATPQPRHENVYLEALARGYTDRRVVANAIAFAEAVALLADRYPNAAFDDIADLVLSDGAETPSYRHYQRKWRVWLLIHHRAHPLGWHVRRPFHWLKRQFTPPARATITHDR